MLDFQAGAVVGGKYQIDRVMGRGGMGVVVAARNLVLQQKVALKFLLDDAACHPAVVSRFVREAQASAQLRGEHVCRVSDVGELDDGAPYMVMELLDGQDLASVLASHGPLPVSLAVDYVMQACQGIAEAHALGLIHRDLKPANLFVTQRTDGSALVKVLDFGIAKSQTEVGAHLTQTMAVLGSPGYMSPEQLRASRDVDVRSDIWSLGVILYELISGERPFVGHTIAELALNVTLDSPPPLIVSMPRGFNEVILKCLEKDPAARYPHVGTLAAALAEFGRERGRESAAAITRILNVPDRIPGPPMATMIAVPITLVSTLPPVKLPRRPGDEVFVSPPITTFSSAASSVQPPVDPRRRQPLTIIAAISAIAIALAIVVVAATPTTGVSTMISAPPATLVPAAAPVLAVPPPPPPPAPAAQPVAVKPVVVKPKPRRIVSRPAAPEPSPVKPLPAPARTGEEDLGASRF